MQYNLISGMDESGPPRLNDMVFAKCENYPYWPGKIIAVNPSSYKVLFYGEKSEAIIDPAFIKPFTEDICREMASEPNARANKDLKRAISLAQKRFQKRSRGQLSESENDHENERYERKTQTYCKNSKLITIKAPENPSVELGSLLNALANQASTFKKTVRVFTAQQQARLRQLLDPSAGIYLSELIENRIIQRFIVVLKELDEWGLREFPELHQLHQLIRKRYGELKDQILSPGFAAIPLRETKREQIVQKVIQNKAVL